jgi:hypothetical protein
MPETWLNTNPNGVQVAIVKRAQNVYDILAKDGKQWIKITDTPTLGIAQTFGDMISRSSVEEAKRIYTAGMRKRLFGEIITVEW